jgi:hypothetical protein
MSDLATKARWLPDDVVLLAPAGTLDPRGSRTLRDALVGSAAGEPRAVIVDVSALDVPTRAARALFPAMARELATWPGLPLIVVDPHGRLLADDRIPVHASVAAAVAAIGDPPPRRVARHALPNTRIGGRLGREFVRLCCRRWQVDEARTLDAVWVANELIENTIKHTFYAPGLRVELRPDALTVAVSDHDPATPRPAVDRPVHGLMMVRRLSRAWGTAPAPGGGKVVWALL